MAEELKNWNDDFAQRELIDRYGFLKAQIADLQEAEKNLREQILAFNASEIDGFLYRVTVSKSERDQLDLDAVREKLSPQFLRAHTKHIPITTVRCTSRKGSK